MPTTMDLPMIDAVVIEVPNPRHPFGLRGVGETPIVPPLAALANAIHDATGVRMTTLPMSPAAILNAIKAKDNGGLEVQAQEAAEAAGVGDRHRLLEPANAPLSRPWH